MTYRQIYDVSNNKLVINLPDSFKNKKQVLVTLDDSVETFAEKLALLKQASSDPLFLSDVKEVNDDFGSIDHETL